MGSGKGEVGCTVGGEGGEGGGFQTAEGCCGREQEETLLLPSGASVIVVVLTIPSTADPEKVRTAEALALLRNGSKVGASSGLRAAVAVAVGVTASTALGDGVRVRAWWLVWVIVGAPMV